MKNTRLSSMSGLTLGVIICLLSAGRMARADFVFGEPELVPNLNSPYVDSQAQISRDGLEIYFLSNRDNSDDLWVSKRLTAKDPWSTPVKLDAPVNTAGPETSPSLSSDGLELYFSNGYADLWITTRTSKTDPWGIPENLGSPVNTENSEDTPCLSTDGLSLYFASDRPDGGSNPSNSDIFVTTRATKDAPWGEPIKLGYNVNSNDYELTPFISPDNLSLFFSRGYSIEHVWVCRRATAEDPWEPAKLFMPVNSGDSLWGPNAGQAEFNLCFSKEDSTLYFGRGTSLFDPNNNIFQVKVSPIVDFNSDDAVDTLDAYALLENWGPTENSLYDIAPMPFGDGVVDAKDLIVLAEHMLVNEQSTDVNNL